MRSPQIGALFRLLIVVFLCVVVVRCAFAFALGHPLSTQLLFLVVQDQSQVQGQGTVCPDPDPGGTSEDLYKNFFKVRRGACAQPSNALNGEEGRQGGSQMADGQKNSH